MKRMKMKPALLLIVAAMLVIVAGCGGGTKTSAPDKNAGSAATVAPTETPAATVAPTEAPIVQGDGPVVTIEMESGKKIKIELFPDIAPNTVNNFISLVNKGFYDGTIFHRVIPQFMIQGGDPDGTGMGGPGYGITGEFTNNGFKNELKHTRGVLSMARSQNPDSAGSQFFIMVAAAPSLDGDYASFGQVFEGMDTVDEIVNQQTNSSDKPVTEQIMKKVTVDTLGVKYEEPKTIAE